jgi:peptidoglycan hydrolase CwlO-like protein
MDPQQYQQYQGFPPPTRPPGTLNIGVREVVGIVTAVGALIGVWVSLNQDITTLKLKVESEEKRVESLNGAIKDVGVSIEQVKIQMAKDKTDLEQTVRDLDNTVSQVYQRMTNTRK